MSPDLKIYSTKTVGKRIAANASQIISAKALGTFLGLGSIFLAARALDVSALGTVTFLHAYMLFFGEVTTFKSWQSIIRFGSVDLEAKDPTSLAKLIKFCMKLDALSAVFAYLLSLALMGLAAGVASFMGSEADMGQLQKYAALYCLVVLLRQIGTADGILRLFDRFTVLALEALVMPGLRFIGTLIAFFNGWGIEGFLLVWFIASGASYIVIFLLGMRELHKRHLLGLTLKSKQSLIRTREGLWPFAIKANIDSSIASGFGHLPQILVMAVFGATWSGIYKIADEVGKVLSEGFKLLDQVIYPELAKLITQGNARKIWRIVQRSAVAMFTFGALASVLVWVSAPYFLPLVFGAEYIDAAPLAALLVPAAALLGMVAPLYPIFYAADKPERAIYVRGLTLVVYVGSFLALSFTIGELAPGWAMVVCNLFAVIMVMIVAKRTLDQSIKAQILADEPDDPLMGDGPVYLIGQSDQDIWGLSLGRWQKRAYRKVGAEQSEQPIVADMKYVLSANLLKSFVHSPNTALIEDGMIVAVNGLAAKPASKMIGQPAKNGLRDGIAYKTADQIDDGYISDLRKTETPYALNIEEVGSDAICKRQFASAYRGITDVINKYIWPVPAFYTARFIAWLRLTPNMVTTLSLFMMVVALYYFWQGQWALGFIIGWFMTLLDVVDGILARTTMSYSKLGARYDGAINLLHPPLWYVAWFVGLGGAFGDYSILAMALIAILAGYGLGRAIEAVFARRFGFDIHVWRPFNAWFKLIAARRNPNMFIFMTGIILSAFFPGAGQAGFIAVAIWIWICIVINLATFTAALLSRKPVMSWME